MLNKPLEVQNVEIATASIEIKTLTLKGKQITLSVFRQIPYSNILNGYGKLRGKVWGSVNYFWEGWAPNKDISYWEQRGDIARYWTKGEHLQILWEYSNQVHPNQLFRSAFITEFNDGGEKVLKKECEIKGIDFDAYGEAYYDAQEKVVLAPQLYIAV
jgi:hypothetical protein